MRERGRWLYLKRRREDVRQRSRGRRLGRRWGLRGQSRRRCRPFRQVRCYRLLSEAEGVVSERLGNKRFVEWKGVGEERLEFVKENIYRRGHGRL